MMRWTIRAKLAALVLAVLLPLVAGAAYKFWRDLRQDRADAQDDMLAAAGVVARHFDEVLSGQIENLEVLASVKRLDRIHDEDLRMVAARVRVRHPFVHRVLAATPDGRITASSAAGSAEAAVPLVDAVVFASVLNERKPRVGSVQPGASGGDPIVPVIVPVLHVVGAPQGVVAAEIDLSSLSAFLDSLKRSPGTSLVIVTDDGILVARSGTATEPLGRPLSASPGLLALVRKERGAVEWRWSDGTLRLATGAAMTAAPWTVIAAMPSDLAYAPAASQLRGNLQGLGIVTLAALCVAWLISRRMTRSVRALMEGAKGLANGEGSAITTETQDELAELAEHFNQAMTERRRAEAASETRQRRIQALAEINLSVSRQLDLEALLRQVTHALARLTGAKNVALWEAHHATRTLVRRAGATDESIDSVDLPERLTFDQGGAGLVVRQGSPLFIEDITHDARIMAADWALRHDLVAFAAVPVVAGEQLLGVLTLNLVRGTLPQGDDRALLSIFASQAAVAIHNAQLFAEAHTRRRAAETLSDLGRTLAQALDLEVVAQRIADSVRALLSVESSALFRLEPHSGDLVPLAVSGYTGGGFDRHVRFPRGTGMVGLATRDRRAVATPNLLTDARVILPPDVRERIEPASYRAILAIPLLVKDTVIGALAVGDREGKSFDEEEIKLAQAFADQSALALDNARLYEETSQRLRHLDSLREVVEQILVPVSLEERLSVIARKAAELFEADRATIALWDGEALVVRAGYGLNAHEVGRVLGHGLGVVSVAARRRLALAPRAVLRR